MMGFERSDDYQPLFWVQGRPVHVTTLLVVLHVAALILCCLIKGITGIGLWPLLDFSSNAVLRHGMIWQVVTYNFSHQPANGLFFLLDMVFLFIWGREVERYFGRKTFIALYSALLLTAPVYLLARGWVLGHDQDLSVEGSTLVDFGVFIVFATIYPNVQFWFGIACKWFAIALLAIWSLQFFASPHPSDGIVLWLTVAVAFFATRYASMGSDAFSILSGLRERLPRKTVPSGIAPRLKARRAVDSSVGGDDYRGRDVHESIDPLLDKISKHGLASLTHSERAVLEKARVSLLRKDRGD